MTHTLLFAPNAGATQDDAHAQLLPQWAEKLEQVMQQDRDFLLQHLETDYYVRPITPAEVREGCGCHGLHFGRGGGSRESGALDYPG